MVPPRGFLQERTSVDSLLLAAAGKACYHLEPRSDAGSCRSTARASIEDTSQCSRRSARSASSSQAARATDAARRTGAAAREVDVAQAPEVISRRRDQPASVERVVADGAQAALQSKTRSDRAKEAAQERRSRRNVSAPCAGRSNAEAAKDDRPDQDAQSLFCTLRGAGAVVVPKVPQLALPGKSQSSQVVEKAGRAGPPPSICSSQTSASMPSLHGAKHDNAGRSPSLRGSASAILEKSAGVRLTQLQNAIPGYTGYIPRRQGPVTATTYGARFQSIKESALEHLKDKRSAREPADCLGWQYEADNLPMPAKAMRDGKVAKSAKSPAPWSRMEAHPAHVLGRAERCALKKEIGIEKSAILHRNLPQWSGAAG